MPKLTASRPQLLRLASLILSLVVPGRSPATAAPGPDDPEVAALLEPIRAKHKLPALAAAIVNPEGVVVAGAVGRRVAEVGPPVSIDDQFHLGSDTKAMTATLLATFVEEGKLSWETTLAKALPDLADAMQPDYRDVTITQLLAHRAGFPVITTAPGMSLNEMRALEPPLDRHRIEYVRRILAEPPAYPPGSKFIYSNRSYMVAGAIAERLGDAPWEELITRRVFQPLGMTTAGFGGQATPGRDDPAQADQPWPHHRFLGLLGKPTPVPPGPGSDNPLLLGPAGTVHASLPDWGRFVACHLRAGKAAPALLKPETFAILHKRPDQGDYAFGWLFAERAWAGGTALTHSGSNTMNYAVVWVAPNRDVAFLAVTNVGGNDAFRACDEAVVALLKLHTTRR